MDRSWILVLDKISMWFSCISPCHFFIVGKFSKFFVTNTLLLMIATVFVNNIFFFFLVSHIRRTSLMSICRLMGSMLDFLPSSFVSSNC